MSRIDLIKQFVIDEFLPDVSADELAADYDLLTGGVMDSLGLLKLIAWIEDRIGAPVSDTDLDPDNFRTVAAIDAFMEAASGQRVAKG
ncbi:phosphopantetheine-binding protein [Thermostaphylospora chromogena]|uniref:Phosphopantetheine attachment site n=1 Tax=Thermostaphylospora chromogena TaxID=35622 RepID=A0A1H1HAP9_9ACTN|nr:phosphopantetheine-binding protein [Thermostaphylospora chromogena]SDR22449.1 Phosphopantetheine attachment site [Thermostaphylospora chromogena]